MKNQVTAKDGSICLFPGAGVYADASVLEGWCNRHGGFPAKFNEVEFSKYRDLEVAIYDRDKELD